MWARFAPVAFRTCTNSGHIPSTSSRQVMFHKKETDCAPSTSRSRAMCVRGASADARAFSHKWNFSWFFLVSDFIRVRASVILSYPVRHVTIIMSLSFVSHSQQAAHPVVGDKGHAAPTKRGHVYIHDVHQASIDRRPKKMIHMLRMNRRIDPSGAIPLFRTI